jgi:hypothetical protein
MCGGEISTKKRAAKWVRRALDEVKNRYRQVGAYRRLDSGRPAARFKPECGAQNSR